MPRSTPATGPRSWRRSARPRCSGASARTWPGWLAARRRVPCRRRGGAAHGLRGSTLGGRGRRGARARGVRRGHRRGLVLRHRRRRHRDGGEGRVPEPAREAMTALASRVHDGLRPRPAAGRGSPVAHRGADRVQRRRHDVRRHRDHRGDDPQRGPPPADYPGGVEAVGEPVLRRGAGGGVPPDGAGGRRGGPLRHGGRAARRCGRPARGDGEGVPDRGQPRPGRLPRPRRLRPHPRRTSAHSSPSRAGRTCAWPWTWPGSRPGWPSRRCRRCPVCGSSLPLEPRGLVFRKPPELRLAWDGRRQVSGGG